MTRPPDPAEDEGLRAAGWEGDELAVRLGFTGAAALRSFSVLRLDGPPEALSGAATFVRFRLELADEARALVYASSMRSA